MLTRLSSATIASGVRWGLLTAIKSQPFRVSNKISNDSRRFHTSRVLTASWFSGVKSAVRNTIIGDDHVNPKKRLERKYLYFALLATHFRCLRLRQLEASNPSNVDDDDALYEKATEELDAKGLDQMSNVDLRIEMQAMLQPQVKDVFEAFQRVDELLGLGTLIGVENDAVSLGDLDSESPYKQILLKELDRTKQQLSESSWRSTCSFDFFTTKQAAIQSLLSFHGWSQDISTGAASETSSKGALLDPFGMNVKDTRESALRLIRKYQTINLCRSALIREELGYSILSLRSSIPGGGRGVFIDGSVMAGSLVAFQPGDIWPKEHLLTTAPDVMEHFAGEDDCQISLRFDDYVVDSRQSPVTVLTQEGSMNPWALGNMANHPSTPTLPNCQSTMLNYTTKMHIGKLMKYIPNSYARVPSWQSKFFDPEEVIMHGLCLVSRRDVSNEELLYDYRLQSDETPDWYSVVKYGDGFEDDQVVFFRDDWRDKQ